MSGNCSEEKRTPKTKEELEALKKEIIDLYKKIAELSEDERKEIGIGRESALKTSAPISAMTKTSNIANFLSLYMYGFILAEVISECVLRFPFELNQHVSIPAATPPAISALNESPIIKQLARSISPIASNT